MTVPIITIDGPTASGKGTVAHGVAQRLAFHYLDSGALYRLTALTALRMGLIDQHAADNLRHQDIDHLETLSALAKAASQLPIKFEHGDIYLAGEAVTEVIRSEKIGNLASTLSVHPEIRQALLLRQRAFCELPGLVADGRDMGTVIFPQAHLKVFLTASVEARAQRRYKQLKEKGISVIFADLLADLEARDARDTHRSVAPLKPAKDACLLDTSEISAEQAIVTIVDWYHAKQTRQQPAR